MARRSALTNRTTPGVEALDERIVPAVLSAYEVKAIEIVNQLRAGPTAFANDLKQLYLGGSYTSPSGWSASDPIWTDLRARINSAESTTSWRSGFNSTGANTFMSQASALPARSPIVWDSGMQDGAVAHNQWMYVNVYAHSVFTQGQAPSIAESQSNPIPGISRNFNVSQGDWFNWTGLNAAGENISYAYNQSGATHQAYRNGQITVDGYYQRLVYADVIGFIMEYSSGGSWGHLQNLAGNYNVLGIDTLLYENPVETYQDGVAQSYFSTHRLGLRPSVSYANLFVYQDANNNNAYDAGEGLAGQLSYNFGATSLTLPTTGYSSVQLPSSGTYTVSATYGGVALGSQQFTANGANKTVAFRVPPIAVTGVAAFVGPTSGGNTVSITGTGFVGVTNVRFGNVNATSFTVVSATQITAVAPAGSPATVNVSVVNAGATTSTTAANDDYTYAVPSVTSVVVNGGTIVAKDRFGNAPSLAGQNSVVTQILVTFSQQVRLDADAFNVTSLAASVTAIGVSPAAVGASVVATGVAETGDATNGYTQYVLTFAASAAVNSFTNASPGNSFTTLKDGVFQLNMIGSRVHAGVSDTAADRTDTFWSLYGAVNAGDVKINGAFGDAATDTLLVDGLALNEVYAAFGSSAQTPTGPPAYAAAYDWNLDGSIDGIDLTKIYQNFGAVWKV